MTDKENKIIKKIKNYADDLYGLSELQLHFDIDDIESKKFADVLYDMLDLIDKQQKEIKELNTELEIRIAWQQYFEKEYINKDKIREKIKEYDKWIKQGDYIESLEAQKYALEELLEE